MHRFFIGKFEESNSHLILTCRAFQDQFQLEDGALLESLRVTENEIAKFPNNAKLHNNRGVMLLQLNRKEEALKSFETAIR